MVEVMYAHNAQSLSPTGSDNNDSRSCSSSMILQPGQQLEELNQPSQLQQHQHQHQQQDGGLSTSAPPPFLTKTYDMIDDPASDSTVSWTSKGTSFVVWSPLEFSRDLLPRYFKHNNFSSFVRQLNTYGFRKVDPDRCEFANEGFRRGQRHLLKNIHRKKSSSQSQQNQQGQSTEITKAGLEGEIERLNRDKNVLMLELVRLRQQQQQTERELQGMGQRLHGTEQRQQHMISFMAKAIQSPGFLQSILYHQEDGGPYLTTKRRRLELRNDEDDVDVLDGKIVRYDPQNEATKARLIEFFGRPDLVSKLEVVPLEVLVRELVPFPEDEQESVHAERQQSGRATLTEMQAFPIALEERMSLAAAPLVTDVTGHSSPVDVPPTPSLDLSLEAKDDDHLHVTSEGGAEGDATSSLGTSGSSGPTSEKDNVGKGTASVSSTRLMRLVGEVNASVDSGAVGVGMNNGFWEQFLGSDAGNNNSTSTGTTTTTTTTNAARRSSPAIPWWATNGKVQEKQPDQQQ